MLVFVVETNVKLEMVAICNGKGMGEVDNENRGFLYELLETWKMVSFLWRWKPNCRLSWMLTALPFWKVPEPPTLENNHNISSSFQGECCYWLGIDQECHILSIRLQIFFQQRVQRWKGAFYSWWSVLSLCFSPITNISLAMGTTIY